MLHELNIGDKAYFSDCTMHDDLVEYTLYESNEYWNAVQTQAEVSQTLLVLNKRIKYDVPTALNTLQNTQPEQANWAEIADDNQNALERILILKYRINGRPFNFEWHLKRHDDSQSVSLPVNLFSSVVDELPSQIGELLDVLRRKEDEITQYKTEFGNLRRSTLQTKQFDIQQYRERFVAADIKVKILQKLVTRWRSQHGQALPDKANETTVHPNSSPTNLVKNEKPENCSPTRRINVKDSPRNRKRKALQAQKLQLTRALNTRRQILEYDSQSQSSNGSQELQDAHIETSNKKKDGSLSVIDVKNPANQISSKSRKSPLVTGRPNTRQRRRDCGMNENNSNDVTIIENNSENLFHTVSDWDVVADSEVATTTISPTKDDLETGHFIGADSSPLKPDNKPGPKNELSAYVDSVLSQLATFDKELKLQFGSGSRDA